MSAFYRKDGSLSAYALACGYVEKAESAERKPYTVFTTPPFESSVALRTAEMYMEHEHFHVRFFDRSNEEWQREWLTFDELPAARKKFAEFSRKVA